MLLVAIKMLTQPIAARGRICGHWMATIPFTHAYWWP